MRAESDTIKDIIYEEGYFNQYLCDMVSSVKNKKLDFSLLAHCESRWGEKILTAAAVELGFKVEFTAHDNITDIAKETSEKKFDMGILVDADCEGITICDKDGRIIDKDKYFVLSSLIIMKQYDGANIAVPVSAPSVIEELAEKYGASVVRTRDSRAELLKACSDSKTEYREQLIFFTDAVAAAIRLMDFLQTHAVGLSDLLKEIPDFYIIRKEINCAPHDKGRIIREMLDVKDSYADLDGVRVRKTRGYVLVIPSGDKNGCRILAEAQKEEFAEELASEYKKIIRNMLKND